MTYRIPGSPCAVALTVALAPLACADPCVDDGLVQDKQDCPGLGTGSATDTENDSATETIGQSATMSATDSIRGSMSASSMSASSMTDSMSATDSMSDSMSATDSMTGADSSTTSDTDTGGTLWCTDADMDGFGDPGDCTMAPDQPPGTVDNDD